MATSVQNLKLSNHARSISLPSSSHPLLASVEHHFYRLRSSENASSSSRTSACKKLDGLKSLYESVVDVLQLQLSQEALSHERNGKWGDEILDGFVRLLDSCGTVKDIYSQMKETVQELESSLRRKRSGELANEVDAYMASKKKLNKVICKCNKKVKKAEKHCTLAAASKDFDLVNLIRGVQEVTLEMLDSILAFISGAKAAGSQPRSRSFISRLLQPSPNAM